MTGKHCKNVRMNVMRFIFCVLFFIFATIPYGIDASTNKGIIADKDRPGLMELSDDETGIPYQVVSNELSVRFNDGLNPDRIVELIESAGASIKFIIEPIGFYVLTFDSDVYLTDMVTLFSNFPEVVYAEPNIVIPVQTIPNDAYFFDLWALENTGQTGGLVSADINAGRAWDLTVGSPELVIGVIDTGVDYIHEDLSANIWQNPGEIAGNQIDDDQNGYIDDIYGWDFVDSPEGTSDVDFSDPDNDPFDQNGHGTQVAGIIAAVGNNGTGITGVSWNSRIMPVRAAFTLNENTAVLLSVDAARGILYAVENGARIINLSWGGRIHSQLIDTAVSYAVDKGVLVCAAAGNESIATPLYPAASEIDGVLSVGATNAVDQRAWFSDFGPWIDVSAPGDRILSTDINNEYTYISGTSAATAHVSGLASLIFSLEPTLCPFDVKTIVRNSADVLPALKNANSTSGRINCYAALTKSDGSNTITRDKRDNTTKSDSKESGDFSFFIDNGDGTVTDIRTGLIWLQNPSCFGPGSYQQVSYKVNNLASGSCGLSDGSEAGSWRIPTAKELLSIVDYTQFLPAISPDSPFVDVPSTFFWTSTPFAEDLDEGTWYVHLQSGGITCQTFDFPLDEFYVWPVSNHSIMSQSAHTPNALPIFIDNGDGTITDQRSGLIWLKKADCFYPMFFEQAKIAVLRLQDGLCGLEDGSQSGDWRLPTIKELLTIIDYSKFDPALPSDHPFTDVQNDFYWTSSTWSLNPDTEVWNVSLADGTAVCHLGDEYKRFSLPVKKSN